MRILATWWQRLLLCVILLAALCTYGYYYLTRTEEGLLFGWKIATKFIPGEIRLENLHGSIHDSISFSDFYYAIDGTTITIDKATVKANLFALIEKQIYIDSLSAENVSIDIPASNPEGPPSTFTYDDLMDILAMIHVNQANIKNLDVSRPNDTLFQADVIDITKNTKNQNYIKILSSNGNVSGLLDLETKGYRHWSIDLDATKINAGLITPTLEGNIDFRVVSEGEWRRHNHQFTLDIPSFSGTVRKHPVKVEGRITYDNGKSVIDHAVIHFADAEATVNGTINDPWNLQWTLTIPNLTNLIPNLYGSLKSNGNIQYINQRPVINALLTANNLRIDNYKINKIVGLVDSQSNAAKVNASLTVRTVSLNNIIVPDTELTIHSNFGKDNITANTLIKFDKHNSIVGDVILPAFDALSDKSKAIAGKFDLNFNNLSLFNEVLGKIRQIRSVTGKLSGSLTLGGTIAKPDITTNIQLNNGSFIVPLYNTQLSKIQMNVLYKLNEPLKLDGRFNMGKGQGTINGDINFTNGLETDISVKGTDLQAANTSEYKAIANPNLNIGYKNNALTLSGSIDIPKATISPADFSTSVTQSNDVIIVNDKAANATPLDLGLDLTLNLGEKIKIKFKDLNSKISGQLHIFQTPGNPPKASGELRTVDGTYTAYGRKLTIQTGRIIYTGNLLANPGIDIRAVQQLKTVGMASESQYSSQTTGSIYTGNSELTVGVWIRGTIKKPLLSLFSDPAGLSQADILSYLILGQPQSKVSGTSSLALLNMAASQYGGGTGNVTNKVQKALGLTDMSVGSTEYYDSTTGAPQSATTVNLGRDLGHNLSIHYNVGVFTSVSILNLRYEISKHFALQTETSSLENGGDLLYEIEGGQ